MSRLSRAPADSEWGSVGLPLKCFVLINPLPWALLLCTLVPSFLSFSSVFLSSVSFFLPMFKGECVYPPSPPLQKNVSDVKNPFQLG